MEHKRKYSLKVNTDFTGGNVFAMRIISALTEITNWTIQFVFHGLKIKPSADREMHTQMNSI